MDVEALERAALAAVAAASTTDEIEAVRVEYLGRKSALKLALREVRDRETGMALNAVRERLEAAIDAREAELARAELDRRLAEERVDVTLPVGGLPRGRLHLITQIRREVEDVFLGLGYHGRRRSRGRDDALQLRRPQLPARSSGALAARDALPRRRDGAAHRDVAVADPHDGGAAAAHLHRHRSVASTAATRPTRRTRRSSTRSRGSPSTRGSRSPTSRARSTSCSRRSSARSAAPSSARTTSRSRSRRSRPYVSCHVCDGDGCPVCRHSGWIEVGGAGMVDPKLFEFVGYDPERYTGFAFGWGLERIAMLRHEFPDLRELWRNDLRFSRQF